MLLSVFLNASNWPLRSHAQHIWLWLAFHRVLTQIHKHWSVWKRCPSENPFVHTLYDPLTDKLMRLLNSYVFNIIWETRHMTHILLSTVLPAAVETSSTGDLDDLLLGRSCQCSRKWSGVSIVPHRWMSSGNVRQGCGLQDLLYYFFLSPPPPFYVFPVSCELYWAFEAQNSPLTNTHRSSPKF